MLTSIHHLVLKLTFAQSRISCCADISCMYAPSSALPAVFAHLDQHANQAVDTALEQSLPHLTAPVDEAAILLLLKRMHKPVMMSLVGRFAELDTHLQSLLQNHTHELSSVIRQVITSHELNHRLGAIELIRRSEDYTLTYLLGEAFRTRCSQTQKLAALTLCDMTAHWLDAVSSSAGVEDAGQKLRCYQALREGLRSAIMRWEDHRCRNVLEAALWMGDVLEADIVRQTSEVRASMVHAIRNMLLTSSDARLAGFAMQALSIPSLKDAAAQAISETTHPVFAGAIADNAWRLVDPKILRGFRQVKLSHWFVGDAPLSHRLNEAQLATAVRLVRTCGGRAQDKLDVLGQLLNSDSEVVRESVVWEVVADRSEQATQLLEIMAGRRRDRVSLIAIRELQRRNPSRHTHDSMAWDADSVGHIRHRVEEAWRQLSKDMEEGIRIFRECLESHRAAVLMLLRAKCASGQTPDRIKALQMILSLDLIADMPEQVYQLSHDSDDYVRSGAVSMLAWLPGVISERILRLALNDPDDRVVANAIESLDELGLGGLKSKTASMLSSPNARIRANAIKSLMRSSDVRAADALLEMLEHQSHAYRLSALWVVERSNLRSIIGTVLHMAQNDPEGRVRRRAQRLLQGWQTSFFDNDTMDSVSHMFTSPSGDSR